MADDKPLKSSFDLAMERLRQADEEAGVSRRPVTDAQKTALYQGEDVQDGGASSLARRAAPRSRDQGQAPGDAAAGVLGTPDTEATGAPRLAGEGGLPAGSAGDASTDGASDPPPSSCA